MNGDDNFRPRTDGALLRMERVLCAPALRVKRFLRDARGTAAVEFAYLVPVILLILIGTIEMSRAVMIDRRFGLATSMVADLVGREEKLTAADVTAIYKIVDQIMYPYSATSLQVSIIPVKASPSDASLTKVYAATTNRPSYHGGTQPAKCAAYTLTSGLVAKGASVIVVETKYSFSTLFGNYVIGASNWTDKAIVNPRNSCVDFDNDNCVSSCF
jgi:Flp pilus assembly protein TadG